jgi:hypothetical protein
MKAAGWHGGHALVGRATFHLALPLGRGAEGGDVYGDRWFRVWDQPRQAIAALEPQPFLYSTSLASISKTLFNFNISLLP